MPRIARIPLIIAVALLGLTVLAASAQAPGGEWPQWRGPNRDGISRETGLLQSWPAGGPRLLWKADGLGGGHGTASVTGGRIYFTGLVDGREVVTALNEADGDLLWRSEIGEPARGVDRYNGPRSTPTVDGDLLYAVGAGGNLVCMRRDNGDVVWRKSFVRDFGGRVPSWGYAESPLVDGDNLIVSPNSRQATIVALNKRTGDVVWRSAMDPGGGAGGYCSAIVVEVGGLRQIVQFIGNGVVGAAAADGRPLWLFGAPANGTANISTPLFSNNHVFAASAYSTGCGLVRLSRNGDGITATPVYASRRMQNHHGGMVLMDGNIYGFDGNNLSCQDLMTGDVRWFDRSVGKGSVTYADGRLYARGERQGIALVEATPEGYREHGRFDQPDRTGAEAWAHPVVAGGRLYIRDQDFVLCYDVKAE